MSEKVRLGTLFDMAKANGWIPPESDRPPVPPIEAYADDVANMGTNRPLNGQSSRLFELVSIRSIIDNPIPIRWAIKHYIEKGGMTLILSPYGIGKTFLALDVAFCIAAGIAWRGNAVTQDSVVILAGEGHSGIANRFKALEVSYEKPCPDNLYISKTPARLTDFADALRVAAAVDAICPTAGVIIIDTVNRNFGGLDESSTKDMTLFINHLDSIFRTSGKTILLVHHTGHNETHRGRGNSVLPASCEGEFLLKGYEGGFEMECVRQKNAEKSKPLFFKFAKVEFPGQLDDEGEPVSSLVLESDTGARAASEPELSRRDREILESLTTAIMDYGQELSFGAVGDLFPLRAVSKENWRAVAYDLPCMSKIKEGSRRNTFGRAIEKLVRDEFVCEYSDFYYPKPSVTSETERNN